MCAPLPPPPLPLAAFDLARPFGLWALVLPLVLLLVARLRTRPPTRPTGTLALWRRVVGEVTPRGARRRSRPPLALWLAMAALVVGTVALAGPRFAPPPAPVRWTVVVDHSPSVSLPWVAEDGVPDAAGRSRLARAAEDALALLADRAAPGDVVRWTSSARPVLELEAGARPPTPWLAAPRGFHARPRWALFDAPGTLWVTDLAPEPLPTRAGLVASGGAPVPGPVGVHGRDRLDWEGRELVAVVDGVGERRVAVLPGAGGAEVPRLLADLFRQWAEERGFVVLAPPTPSPEGAELLLEPLGGEGAFVSVAAGRDGWILRGEAVEVSSAAPRAAGATTWLAADDNVAGAQRLVDIAPGRIAVAWRRLPSPPVGDPAAFAVSWARLFDECVLPPSGVVPLAARRTSGAAATRSPVAPPRRAAARAAATARADLLDAWLTAGSALLALAALSAGFLRRG